MQMTKESGDEKAKHVNDKNYPCSSYSNVGDWLQCSGKTADGAYS
ncbi:hypothetical protein ALT1545_110116 [Alteromonas macleodii]